MTSKRLFANLLKENFKRRIWTIALSIACNFFAQIVYTMLIISHYSERLSREATTLEDIRIHFYNYVGGMGNLPVLIITCVLPVILSLQGYNYLTDSRQTDLYYSLPIKREKLFDINNLCGIIIFAVPYLVFNLITVIIGLSRGYATLDTILLYPLSALVIIVAFVMLYELCSLAVVMTGHIVVALLGCGVFFFIGPVVRLLYVTLMSTFFATYYGDSSLYAIDFKWSPIGLITDTIAHFHGDANHEIAFYTFDAAPGLLTILVTAVLSFAISRMLIKRRPAEAAGKAMAFNVTKPVIKMIISCIGALGSGIVMYYIASAYSIAMFIFGMLCGLIMVHVVIETIYEFDFKACLKNYGTLMASAVISGMIFIAFVFDIFGYETWQPMPSKVSSVAIGEKVTYSGLIAPVEKSRELYPSDIYGSFTVSGSDYALCNMTYTDIEKAEIITRQGAINAKRAHKEAHTKGRFTQGYMYYSYDDNNTEASYSTFTVQWNMKNGKKIRRIYLLDMNDDNVLAAYKEIFNSEEYKLGKFPVFGIKKGEIDTLGCENITGDKSTKLSDEDMAQFIKIYSEELKSQSFDDLNNEKPCCILYGSKNDGVDVSYDRKYNFYIFDSFKGTLAFLKDHGISTSWKDELGDINSITVKLSRWDEAAKQSVTKEWKSNEKSEISDVLGYIGATDILDAKGEYLEIRDRDNYICVEAIFNTSKGTFSDYMYLNNNDKLPAELRGICFDNKTGNAEGKDNSYGWVNHVNNG